MLFGSKAKGKAHEYSDTDIAIFFEKKTKATEMRMERIVEKYPLLKIQYHIFNRNSKDHNNISRFEKIISDYISKIENVVKTVYKYENIQCPNLVLDWKIE